jgi:decaprenyl-phosphate phosphoribosyltransferase
MTPTQQPLVPTAARTRYPYLSVLRPQQWTKNLIIFAAPLFAFQINAPTLKASLIAFVAFCALSSCFYLVNDLLDLSADRQHPLKRYRPIAAGQVKIAVAIGMAGGLILGAFGIGWLLSKPLAGVLLSYTLLQIAYNWKLKRAVLLDVIAIATGFVLRAYAGAAASGVMLSPWFVLCTAMLALFLAIEKRKAELRLLEAQGAAPGNAGGKTRRVLGRYSHTLLSRMENTVTTGVIMTYTLWSSGPQVRGASTPWMLVTLPFVLYGVFRYQFLSDPSEIARRHQLHPGRGEQTERPDELLLKDWPLCVTVLGWVCLIFVILWLRQQGAID